jgi:hypothetical protein
MKSSVFFRVEFRFWVCSVPNIFEVSAPESRQLNLMTLHALKVLLYVITNMNMKRTRNN